MKVITFGTFDLLHIGHINILKNAKSLGDELIVGVSTDKFSIEKKNRKPIYNENNRKQILESLKFVDKVFFEESFEKKREYIKKYKADIFVMGNDWEGRFDEFNDICKVVYFDRTPSISTTNLIEVIANNN
jgi:glycerol-3-phosphate cytidylyltransferase